MEKQHEQELSKEVLKQQITHLTQMMEAFNKASENLQSSYHILQEEVHKLRRELEDKNRELADLSKLLESVLNNTRSAIIVTDDDGEIIVKNRSGDKLLENLGSADVMRMLKSAPNDGVYDYDSGDGTYYRLSAGELITDNLSGTVFVVDDITKIKKMEFERQRGEKLQLMGGMAANIAHEIRNPLGSMELFTSLLERELKEPDQKRLAHSILKAIRIIEGTISNTLLFTKEVQVHKSKYVLADIVDDVILYLQHELKEKKISIINRLDETHYVFCDRDMFRQVVMNLVHNAIDAVGAGGKVILSSRQEEGMVVFTVTDNGSGLSQDMRAKLFMPFQTTKAKGTGLGLSIAYKIVRAHGGDITADSDSRSFTSFSVFLPVD